MVANLFSTIPGLLPYSRLNIVWEQIVPTLVTPRQKNHAWNLLTTAGTPVKYMEPGSRLFSPVVEPWYWSQTFQDFQDSHVGFSFMIVCRRDAGSTFGVVDKVNVVDLP